MEVLKLRLEAANDYEHRIWFGAMPDVSQCPMAERRLDRVSAAVGGRTLYRNQGGFIASLNWAPADATWFPDARVAGGKR